MRLTQLHDLVVSELGSARGRSLTLLEAVSDEDQLKQHSPLMSPLVWDLAHVGNYEELWLLRAVAGKAASDGRYDDIYDAFRHDRASRAGLALMGPDEARLYLEDVRTKVLDVLGDLVFDSASPLLRDAFVYGMVVQHEHQHDETMLATLALMEGEGYRPVAGEKPAAADAVPEEVFVQGGPFVMGTGDHGWAYDNERPGHVVDVAPFFIDAAPVTNAQWMAFMDAGGYERPELWSAQGWKWRVKEGLEAPQFWYRSRDGYRRVRFGYHERVPDEEPVQHVCYWEADAYARWAGKRLPTEAEWEKAASWDGNVKRVYPWGDTDCAGRANLGQRLYGPAPVGSYPSGVSPYGCHQMIGDVWEWTSTDFGGHPGFESFPYDQYSQVFFGTKFKVLKGGSWATWPVAARTSFRNWDFPIRRQIFCGLRCARDAS